MVDVTFIRSLNKSQGHSFWYQSISYNTTSYRLSTHRLATIHNVTDDDDRRTQQWTNSAIVSTVS